MGEEYKEIVGRAAWEAVMKRQVESGLTGVEFCRREGINLWQFKRWRSSLKPSGGSGRFIQVKTPKGESPRSGGIEMEFPSGLILSVRG